MDKAQMRFTDPELGIMQTGDTGWDYGGNARASVDGAYQIIVACAVTAAANDTQQAVPMAQWTVAHLEQAGMSGQKTPRGWARRCRGTMTAAITARRRQPP